MKLSRNIILTYITGLPVPNMDMVIKKLPELVILIIGESGMEVQILRSLTKLEEGLSLNMASNRVLISHLFTNLLQS